MKLSFLFTSRVFLVEHFFGNMNKFMHLFTISGAVLGLLLNFTPELFSRVAVPFKSAPGTEVINNASVLISDLAKDNLDSMVNFIFYSKCDFFN